MSGFRREARRVYDIRELIGAIVDGGEMLELGPGWARNMVTGLARIDGRPVGVIANQPWRLGGVIDSAAAEKGALFVDACDRFGLPLVVLVDTPGFMPGRRQEEAGVIRHGASLLRAFASATVPKLTVIVRKAYGGAVITMNSKELGADMVFAWPRAEIGIMAASQAVGISERRRLAADPGGDLRDRLATAYAAEHLTADAAAASGFVDEVIEPEATERPPRLGAGCACRRMSAVGQRPAGVAERLRGRRIRGYAALGDSFTAGTGCERGECWADRLADALAAVEPGLRYRNLAVEGARSERVLDQLEPALELEPDLATVICGTNDVLFSVRPNAAAYRRHLSEAFSRLLAGPRPPLVVTATAPERWDFLDLGPRTRARLARGLSELNRTTRAVAADYDVVCLETADHPGLADASNFIADGLHPSATGHRVAAAGFAHLLGLAPQEGR